MTNLTIVVTGRNDDYDGNFEERLIVSLTRNIQSLPDAEFIFVEWNPLLDRDLVSEHLIGIFGDKVKCYVVDPKYHKQYCTCDWFIEYPAKNIGIRKSTRDFVLCTNSDIVFSPEVAEVLKKPLKRNVMYRAVRVDIPVDYINIEFPVLRQYKLSINKGPMNAAGDFLLLDKGLWYDLTGYCEEFPEQRLHKDAFIIHILQTRYKVPMEELGSITHWRHPSSWSNNFQRPRVGDPRWDFRKSGYSKNKDTWGLSFAREEKKDGLIWLR